MAEHEFPSFTIRVPRSFEGRYAAIYRPHALMGVDAQPKYSCCFPADALPVGAEDWLGSDVGYGWRPLVREPREADGPLYGTARSSLAPMVIAGPRDGCTSSRDWWAHQLRQCDAMNLPRDSLFRWHALDLLVQPRYWEQMHGLGGKLKRHGILLDLKAVMVVDPTDDSGLRAYERERREAITEGRKTHA